MKLRDFDSPIKRMAVAIGAGVTIAGAIALVYLLAVSNSQGEKVNGIRVVAAARAYTRQLLAARQPIPKSVSVEQLVASGFLKPDDVAAFRGLDATVLLTTDNPGPKTVLMRLHLPDGSDLVLLADGSVQSAPR